MYAYYMRKNLYKEIKHYTLMPPHKNQIFISLMQLLIACKTITKYCSFNACDRIRVRATNVWSKPSLALASVVVTVDTKISPETATTRLLLRHNR